MPPVTFSYATLPSGTLEAATTDSKEFLQTTAGKAGITVLLVVLVLALSGFVVFVFRSRRRRAQFAQGASLVEYPEGEGGSLAGLNRNLPTPRGDEAGREPISSTAGYTYKPWHQQRRPAQDVESSFYDQTPVATMGWASHQPEDNPFTPENPFNDSNAYASETSGAVARRNSLSTVEPWKYPRPPPAPPSVPSVPPVLVEQQNYGATLNRVSTTTAPSLYNESAVTGATEDDSLANAEVRMAIMQRQTFRPLTPPSESGHSSSNSHSMTPKELVKNHKLLLHQPLQSSSPTRL